MFKISYKVKGDNLGQVLKPTAGVVSDLEIMPVENEPVRSLKGKPGRKKKDSNQYTQNGPMNYTEKFGLQSGMQFKGRDIFPNIKAAGYSTHATWTYIGHEVKAGRVRKIGPGLYVVV